MQPQLQVYFAVLQFYQCPSVQLVTFYCGLGTFALHCRNSVPTFLAHKTWGYKNLCVVKSLQ